MAVLCIIDMQPSYRSAQDAELRRRVCRLIRKHEGPVFIVEFDGNPKTYRSVLHASRSQQVVHCIKSVDDGSDVIIGAQFATGLGNHKNYVLCGVNTPWCVLNTAQGLLHKRKNSKVQIVAACCLTHEDLVDSFDFVTGPTSEAVLRAWLREDDYLSPRKRRRSVSWKQP